MVITNTTVRLAEQVAREVMESRDELRVYAIEKEMNFEGF
jgi:hypothetical protein